MRQLNTLNAAVLLLISTSFAFAQVNKSDGAIQTFINTPPPQFNNQEIFRFQPGVVTQLDLGNFNFNTNDRWFALGHFNDFIETVYGLRFQSNRKALFMGYKPIDEINPRIQWYGDPDIGTLGDLEFRVADDFTSTNSSLVATMRNDGSTIFGFSTPSLFNSSKVGILGTQRDLEGLRVYLDQSDHEFSYAGYFTAVGSAAYGSGVFAESISAQHIGYGVYAQSLDAPEQNYGVFARVDNSGSENNFAIYGSNPNPITPGLDFAGFFDGDVTVTGTFTSISDEQLKKDVEAEEGILEQIEKLRPVVYQFKETEKISLPSGPQHGFIAQELEKVFPELVQEITKPVFDEDGKITGNATYKSVNYIGMISILAQSVKELNSEVGRLQEELSKAKQTYVVLDRALSEQEIENLQGKAYVLEQNIPNPYGEQTSITYKVPESDNSAVIMVFNMSGNLLKTYELDTPEGRLTINSEELGRGIFLYSLVSQGQEIITKRMIIE